MATEREWIINKKFGVIVLTIGVLLVGAVIIGAQFRHIPGSCNELRERGITYVVKGDRDYNAALDNDHDGIACE